MHHHRTRPEEDGRSGIGESYRLVANKTIGLLGPGVPTRGCFQSNGRIPDQSRVAGQNDEHRQTNEDEAKIAQRVNRFTKNAAGDALTPARYLAYGRFVGRRRPPAGKPTDNKEHGERAHCGNGNADRSK